MSEDLETLAKITAHPEVFYASQVSYLGPAKGECVRSTLRILVESYKKAMGKAVENVPGFSAECIKKAYELLHPRNADVVKSI